MSGAVALEGQVALFNGIDVMDKPTQVDRRLFPIMRSGLDHVKALSEAEFEAHWDHDPCGKQRTELIALFHGRRISLRLLGKPFSIMTLGKADG